MSESGTGQAQHPFRAAVGSADDAHENTPLAAALPPLKGGVTLRRRDTDRTEYGQTHPETPGGPIAAACSRWEAGNTRFSDRQEART